MGPDRWRGMQHISVIGEDSNLPVYFVVITQLFLGRMCRAFVDECPSQCIIKNMLTYV